MKLLSALQGLIQGSDPSSPPAGSRNLYTKSDGWYDEDSSGNIAKLGPLSVLAVVGLSGNYMGPPHITAVTAGVVTNGTTTYVPINVPVTTTFDRIAVNVTTAAVAGTAPALRLGIYKDNGSFSGPGARVVDAGTVTITATGVQAATINVTLQPGMYWLAAQYTHTVAPTTGLQVNCINTATTGFTGFGGYRYHAATGQSGALPTPAPTVTQQTGATGIVVGIRPA